jgi:hypothetical protein
MVVVDAFAVALLALPGVGFALTFGYMGTRLVNRAARSVRRALKPPKRPVRPPPDSSRLALVEGAAVPGGGAVDYFGFGFGGELVLFGTAIDRLMAAAGELGAFSYDKLDRLLLDGPPFAEAVAGAARRAGRDWDEGVFRAQLDDTLARRDFTLVLLMPQHARTGRKLSKRRE